MPIPTFFRELITRLIEATAQRKVNWAEGPGNYMHSASLSNYSVQIQSMRSTNQSLIPASQFPLLFNAIDSDGRMLDQFVIQPQEKEFLELQQLYEAALRSSRKIDEKVAAMLREIDAKLKQ